MKRILALLILLMTVAIVPAYATDKIKVSPEVYAGIKKYKQGNYASCIQQMRVAIEKMKDEITVK